MIIGWKAEFCTLSERVLKALDAKKRTKDHHHDLDKAYRLLETYKHGIFVPRWNQPREEACDKATAVTFPGVKLHRENAAQILQDKLRVLNTSQSRREDKEETHHLRVFFASLLKECAP